ncbi:unnamed protein product [Paramecium octaurelia]|uniref:Uncharacterized protein n=1 Tax=Paramecium octaurelia TaxID=43137 RepID=A0A8S1UDY3_PAROT|nr:unnamed protein product [Paramecium octaurelia]
MCDNSDSSGFSSKSSEQKYKEQDHQNQQNSESENDQIKKKPKLVDDNEPIKISRKVSDDLIKIFERLPNDQITKLLDVIKVKNSPDLPVQVNLGDLMTQEDDFVLDSQSDSQKEKMRKRRESKEKVCKCCSQFVKRHHCTHSECEKPCQAQEKIKKTKA